MSATTVLRRVIAIPAVRIVDAELVGEVLVVDVRLRRRRLRCPACPFTTRSVYDHLSPRLWRHLDLAGRRCFLLKPLRRLRCPAHGIVTEIVPFAPPRAGYTYAFEDVVAWLAQRSDKTAITQVLRVSWRSVGRILGALDRPPPERRRPGRPHPHQRRREELKARPPVRHRRRRSGPASARVWMTQARDEATLGAFFDELGPERTKQLTAIGTDMAAWYPKAIAARAPDVAVCIDPFHVVALANRALDEVRRSEWNRARCEGLDARAKYTRWALLKHPSRLSDEQRTTLALVRRHNARLWRGCEIKEMVRAVYATAPSEAGAWLDGAIRRAGGLPLRGRLHRPRGACVGGFKPALHHL